MRFEYRAACAKIKKKNCWETDYSGLLCRSASLQLGRYVRGITGYAPVVERLTSSLIATGDEPFELGQLSYLKGTQPGAIVVRPDQYESISTFCALLAQIGVVRVPFLDENLAREWVAALG